MPVFDNMPSNDVNGVMNEKITLQLAQPGHYQPNWTLGFCTLTLSFFFLTDRPKHNVRVLLFVNKMKNRFGSALLNSVSKDRNVSSGLKCPVVCHWHPYSGLNFFFVFEETQLTLLVKQNKYIHCK